MSLSCPAKFPLLKLPFLCIEAVIKSSDIFDIIFFVLLSQKTRRIVKSLKIPLDGIEVMISKQNCIRLGRFYKSWNFMTKSSELFLDQNSKTNPLVLRKNAVSLFTKKTNSSLESYSDGNEIAAFVMAMEFLNEVFKCSVQFFNIYEDNFPESGDIGVKSTENVFIRYQDSQPYGQIRNQKLNLLLESMEVTGTCQFWVTDIAKDFFCDPKLLKCETLVFWSDSAAWVTREILLQFEVPRLHFLNCQLPVENIVSFVDNWFHSDNKKLECLYIKFPRGQISLEEFRGWNALPFEEGTRVPSPEAFKTIDFSKGLEIVRHDGLQATIHVNGGRFLFYIWHHQCALQSSNLFVSTWVHPFH